MDILLFAGVRERAARDSIEIDIDLPATAEQVLGAVADRIPDAAELIRVSRLAVDGSYVGPQQVLNAPIAEIALIPPVSGG